MPGECVLNPVGSGNHPLDSLNSDLRSDSTILAVLGRCSFS
jgi:hypothetical protein